MAGPGRGGGGLLQLLCCLWLCQAATRPRVPVAPVPYAPVRYYAKVGEEAGEEEKEHELPALVMVREE